MPALTTTPSRAAASTCEPVRHPAWPGVALCLGAAAVALGVQGLVSAVSPLLVAIVLGVVVGNIWTPSARFAPGLAVSGKRLLRLGIVLLGLQVSLREIAGLGAGMIAVVVAVVGLGIGGTLLMGRALGVPPMQRLLIACGFSICGAAAIAGVEGSVDAEEEDVAAAIGLVVVYGTAMIALAPLVLGALPLTERQQGLVAGASIHEVAQVVAVGGLIGGQALAAAVVVKLARVLLLAPVLVVVGGVRRRTGRGLPGRRPPLVPLFVAGFLAACLVASLVSLPHEVLGGAQVVQNLLLAASMFALGTGVRADVLRRVGGRPVVLGALSTLLVFGVALGGVLMATSLCASSCT